MPDNTTGNPNDRYDERVVYTISSTADADTFCNTYNHSNNYSGLALGQMIKINDGAYNAYWHIAGFDMEYNHRASDGTTKDNGYGICLIPVGGLSLILWNNSYTHTAYINSRAHTYYLPIVANNLKKVLGNHLINRNVLLGDEVTSSSPYSYNYYTTSYAWTTSYLTLMSGCQLTGSNRYYNQYDSGEANYKLPLFDYIGYKCGSPYWLRGTRRNGGNYDDPAMAYCVTENGITTDPVSEYSKDATFYCCRPMIYIR